MDTHSVDDPSPQADNDPAQEFLTILTTRPKPDGNGGWTIRYLTKQLSPKPGGGYIVRNRDPMGKYFSAVTMPVDGLADIEQLLPLLEPNQGIVFGRPKSGVNLDRMLRRSDDRTNDKGEVEKATLEDQPLGTLAIDVENCRVDFNPINNIDGVLNAIAPQLPPELQCASCLWQWSSSAGADEAEPNKVHLHLFYHLSRRMTLAEQKAWLQPYLIKTTKQADGSTVKTGIIDGSCFSPEHLFYSAAPVLLDGAVDPVAERVGFSASDNDVVQVPDVIEASTGPSTAPAGDSVRVYSDDDREEARRCLCIISPDKTREEWLPIGAAVCHIYDGDDAGLELALLWNRGVLWRHGTFTMPADAQYRGDDEIKRVYGSCKGNHPAGRDAGLDTLRRQARAEGEEPFSSAEIFGPASRWAEYATEGTGEAGTTSKFIRLQRLTEFLKRPDPVELIVGMMMEGENCAIVGEPKSGKSFLAIDMGMSLAGGLPIAGHHKVTRHGPVIYLSGEGHAGMKRRLLAWCRHRGLTPERIAELPFHYNEGVIPATATEEELEAAIAEILKVAGQPVMVILDTMARSLGGLDENTAATASMYLNLTEKLRSRLKTNFVSIVHASNKGANKGGKIIDIRGSSAFSAGFDAVWTTDKEDATRTMTMKSRWLKEADNLGPFYFRMTEFFGTCVLTYVDPKDAERKEAALAMSNKAMVTAKLAELGMIGSTKGQSGRVFAEAWHAPVPGSYIGYLHAKDGRVADQYLDQLSEAAKTELQRWLGEVDKTQRMLKQGAASKKSKSGRQLDPTLAGLFEDLPNMREQGKMERLWFLPAGYVPPAAPEPEEY